MNRGIRSDPTDDPDFIALVERIAGRLYTRGQSEEVFIIEVKNWFDHKWLKFSGRGRIPFHSHRDSHPQVSLDVIYQDKITFPPFSPNRIIRQQWHSQDQSKKSQKPIYNVHVREHSQWNLQKRVSQYSRSAVFLWFSSGTLKNDRGSLMVYEVEGDSVSAWYASFKKASGWTLDQTKEISREFVQSLIDPKVSSGSGPDED